MSALASRLQSLLSSVLLVLAVASLTLLLPEIIRILTELFSEDVLQPALGLEESSDESEPPPVTLALPKAKVASNRPWWKRVYVRYILLACVSSLLTTVTLHEITAPETVVIQEVLPQERIDEIITVAQEPIDAAVSDLTNTVSEIVRAVDPETDAPQMVDLLWQINQLEQRLSDAERKLAELTEPAPTPEETEKSTEVTFDGLIAQ